MSARVAVAALGCALAVAGCGGTPAIGLGADWPTQPRDYRVVAEAWTRKGHMIRGFDTIIEVAATFKSPEWRAAHVERRARAEKLPPEERRALLEAEQAAAAEHHEFELLVSTYHHRENDLQKGDKSMWRIALVDDEGRQVRPVDIQSDRRPGPLLATLFPEWQPFHKAYVVRFPRTIDPLGPDAKRFSLIVASAHGAIELVWSGAR